MQPIDDREKVGWSGQRKIAVRGILEDLTQCVIGTPYQRRFHDVGERQTTPFHLTKQDLRIIPSGDSNCPTHGIDHVYSLLLRMAIEIVSFPIKNGGSFHVMLVYRRVLIKLGILSWNDFSYLFLQAWKVEGLAVAVDVRCAMVIRYMGWGTRVRKKLGYP